MEFVPFPKIPRLNRAVTVTEKLDGTNARVSIRLTGPETDSVAPFEHGIDSNIEVYDGDYAKTAYIRAGSRNRWLPTGGSATNPDNFGFGAWVHENASELADLGIGEHFGEWWGAGVGRRYGLTEKRFSLFNVHRWRDGRAKRPMCCGVVPVLAEGIDGKDFQTSIVMERLKQTGSVAAPGFMKPEGVVVWHSATRSYTKATCENDESHKGETA